MVYTRIKPGNKEVQLKKYTEDCHNSFYFQTIFLFQMDYVYNAIVYNHNFHTYKDRWMDSILYFFIIQHNAEPFFKFNLMIQSQKINMDVQKVTKLVQFTILNNNKQNLSLYNLKYIKYHESVE